MKLVQATSMAQAWVEAAQHLLTTPQLLDTTLVLHIDEPMLIRRQDKAAAAALDSFLVAHGLFSHHTVAETIFPGYEYRRHGVEGVYTKYPEEVFPRIQSHPDTRSWGTYAHRLVRRVDSAGKEIVDAEGKPLNPLERCIAKMRDKNPKRAAYELGLGFGFDLATYDDAEDGELRMGGPCLSHLSFKVINTKVHLTALYRSHYYVHRAYGNLLGLARLLQFVADQAQFPTGSLVCHSTMAVLEHSGTPWNWKKTEVRALVETCTGLLADVAPDTASPEGAEVPQ